MIADDTVLLPAVMADAVVAEAEAARGCQFDDRARVVAKLVDRAEAVYAANPSWARSIRSRRGRDVLWGFMTHWLEVEHLIAASTAGASCAGRRKERAR